MMIATLTQKPDHTPRSFNDLLPWLNKIMGEGIIDGKYVQAVKSCDWFQYVKSIRDSIEHYGSRNGCK